MSLRAIDFRLKTPYSLFSKHRGCLDTSTIRPLISEKTGSLLNMVIIFCHVGGVTNQSPTQPNQTVN